MSTFADKLDRTKFASKWQKAHGKEFSPRSFRLESAIPWATFNDPSEDFAWYANGLKLARVTAGGDIPEPPTTDWKLNSVVVKRTDVLEVFPDQQLPEGGQDVSVDFVQEPPGEFYRSKTFRTLFDAANDESSTEIATERANSALRFLSAIYKQGLLGISPVAAEPESADATAGNESDAQKAENEAALEAANKELRTAQFSLTGRSDLPFGKRQWYVVNAKINVDKANALINKDEQKDQALAAFGARLLQSRSAKVQTLPTADRQAKMEAIDLRAANLYYSGKLALDSRSIIPKDLSAISEMRKGAYVDDYNNALEEYLSVGEGWDKNSTEGTGPATTTTTTTPVTTPATPTTTTTTTTGGSTGPGSSTGETGDSDVGDVYLSYKRDMGVWLKDFYAAYDEDRYGDAYNAAESIRDLTVAAYRHYEKASDVPNDIYVLRWFLFDIFNDELGIIWTTIKNTDSRARLRLAFRHAMVDVLAKAFDEFIETSPTPTLKFAEGTNGPYPKTEYGKARKKYDDVVKEIRGLPFFESLETGDSFPRFGSGATTEGGTRGADPRPSTTRALTGSRSVTATTFPRVGSGAPTESGTQPSRRFDFFTLIEPSTRELTEHPKPKEAPATQAFDPNNYWYYGPVGTNGFSKADDEKHFRYSRGLEKVPATNPWIPQAREDLR
jgi:hypothetical protein